MDSPKIVYRGFAKAIGGREGRAAAHSRSFDLYLTTPKELGGPGGEGTNPEELFAAGYSACFISALRLVASKEQIQLPADTSIEGIVGIGPVNDEYAIEAELRITIPGLDKTKARSLIEKANIVCPYSRATRGNINVTLTLKD